MRAVRPAITAEAHATLRISKCMTARAGMLDLSNAAPSAASQGYYFIHNTPAPGMRDSMVASAQMRGQR